MVPFVAVAVADVLNLGIIRRDEYLEGIAVYDEQQKSWTSSSMPLYCWEGVSSGANPHHATTHYVTVAAKECVAPTQTVPGESRMPELNLRLCARGSTDSTYTQGLPIFMGLIGLHIHIAVPLMLGISRQTARARGNDLEAEFHKYKYVLYNKGI
eukprot:scaffold1504_cov417-Prasinococcus_capsulatus_cf.AAC.33